MKLALTIHVETADNHIPTKADAQAHFLRRLDTPPAVIQIVSLRIKEIEHFPCPRCGRQKFSHRSTLPVDNPGSYKCEHCGVEWLPDGTIITVAPPTVDQS